MQPATQPLTLLLVTLAGWMHRHEQRVLDYLLEENRVLREQLHGRRLRLNDDQRRRLAAKGQSIGRAALVCAATIVTPDTILRWYRRLIAAKWTYPSKRVGRPGLMNKIKAHIVRMSTDNPSWGYCSIQGELKVLGHKVASSTIANVLKARRGCPPQPLTAAAPSGPSGWPCLTELPPDLLHSGWPCLPELRWP